MEAGVHGPEGTKGGRRARVWRDCMQGPGLEGLHAGPVSGGGPALRCLCLAEQGLVAGGGIVSLALLGALLGMLGGSHTVAQGATCTAQAGHPPPRHTCAPVDC